MKTINIFNFIKGGSLFLLKGTCPKCKFTRYHNIEQQSGKKAKIKCYICEAKFIIQT